MTRRTLVIATRNPGKLREFRRLLGDLPLELVSLEGVAAKTCLEETGESFEENAVLKAVGYSKVTGALTLSDDSGLEVDALRGEPGVHSARYAGLNQTDEGRNRYLLTELEGVPAGRRTARYRAVLAMADPAQPGIPPITVEGVCEGRIAESPAGENGFGYDPLFWVDRLGRTMAQLSADEKDAISHRGIAARKMAVILRELIG